MPSAPQIPSVILALSEHVAERLDQLAIRETQLDMKEARVAKVEQAAATKALELVERAAVFTERQNQLAIRETQLDKKESRLAEVEQAAAAKALELAERAAVLARREDQLTIRGTQLDKNEARNTEVEKDIVEKTFDQAECAAVLNERQGRVAKDEVRAASEVTRLSNLFDRAERLFQCNDSHNVSHITILTRQIEGLKFRIAEYERAAKRTATRHVAHHQLTKYSALVDHHKPNP